MLKTLMICALVAIATFCFGQVEIAGTVTNRDTKEAIAYANIGIPRLNIGTLSNPDGSFSIRIPQKSIRDTLLFSALGFGEKPIPIQMLLQKNTIKIYLWEKVILLPESQKTSDGKETGYGLGWYVGKDKNGHRMWHHSGDLFSSSSHLFIYPDDNLVVAFLANGQEGAAFDVQRISELFYK